jgi:hypothetical protein
VRIGGKTILNRDPVPSLQVMIGRSVARLSVRDGLVTVRLQG